VPLDKIYSNIEIPGIVVAILTLTLKIKFTTSHAEFVGIACGAAIKTI
jgi:hypothetical protein